MTESEKIEFVAGRVHALIGFVTAVILTHPRPDRLAVALEKIGQVNLAKAESVLVDDTYIEGLQDMQKRIKEAIDMALRAPTPRE